MPAHPQEEENTPGVEPAPEGLAKNPFPTQVVVPGVGGEDVAVELAVVDGVVYAPALEDAQIDPGMRQYVINYCAAWSSSVLTTGRLANQWPATPPRRAQIVFTEPALHAMLGLAPDERLIRVDADQVNGRVRFLVESPRLPAMSYWDGGPPIITLPVAAHYEQPVGGQ
jgi:hypothetical protein